MPPHLCVPGIPPGDSAARPTARGAVVARRTEAGEQRAQRLDTRRWLAHDPPEDEQPGDGVDEHLNASVKELDMPERLIGLCENAGITKIAHVVKVLDDSDGDAPSLGEKVNGSDKDAKAIAKAVKTFRTAHRKAAMKAEGIES